MRNCFKTTDISQALETWKRGGLVAIPTETVFGLAAPINEEVLVSKIFEYKERPLYDPLIIHVSGIDMAKKYVTNWPPLAETLAKEFWPGPLTIVLPKVDAVSPMITSGLSTVGIRCPNNDLTLKLIREVGVPLAAPSANKFTKTSPTKVEHVTSQFKDQYLCVLESKQECEVGIESTIIQILEDRIEILRPGILTEHDFKSVLPDLIITKSVTAREKKERIIAPGQDEVHYRPDYPLFYSYDPNMNFPDEYDVVLLDKDAFVVARKIYSLMRSPLPIGKSGRIFIVPEFFGDAKQGEVWDSILNRLLRAAKECKLV